MQVPEELLQRLIITATDRTSPALDGHLLSQIKGLCRQSDAHVQLAWQALWAQLRAPHAQTRLLALLLCEQLFERSRAFRHALCEQLSQFLEAVLGFREERPLPPPAAAACELRQKALELLEGWAHTHGGRHKQLPLAVRYVKDTLQYQLPEVATRAAAAEAERVAREQRQRQQLHARLEALLGGGEWREGASTARQLLREMEECFAILDEQAAAEAAAAEQRQHQQDQAEEAEGLQWEDVAEDAAAAGLAAGEGLAAYAATDEAAEQEAAAVAAAAAAAEAGTGAEMEVVLETLAGLYRQLTNRTLPQVQDFLSVLGRAEAEGPAQQQAQQRALHAATELRGRLAAARGRCDAMSLDLQALLLSRQRREQAAAEAAVAAEERLPGGSQQTAAVAAAMQDLFGDSSSSGAEEDATKAAAVGHWGRPQNTAAVPTGGSRRQQQQQGPRRPQHAQQEADDNFVSPYLSIVDPAAPRSRPAQQQKPQAAEQQARCPPRVQRTSSLPEEVRRKLAEQAPVLPTGLHTQFWDSKSVPTFVSSSGLEVSNHWGPVDVHQELPPERLEELFLLPMPAAPPQQRPPAQQQQQQQRIRPPQGTAAAGRGQARQSQQQQQQQQQGQQQAGQQQQPGAPAAASLQPWPSRQEAAGSAAAPAAGPSVTAAVAGMEEGRAAKRARRAQERAYNEAIIGGALSDELVARQLQETEQQQQQQQAGDSGKRGRTAKRMGVRDRLASKLLQGRVVAAAAADAALTDSELRRDKFGNRW